MRRIYYFWRRDCKSSEVLWQKQTVKVTATSNIFANSETARRAFNDMDIVDFEIGFVELLLLYFF